jgi:hypothetical protein
MSNQYGFDFLRSEHLLDEDGPDRKNYVVSQDEPGEDGRDDDNNDGDGNSKEVPAVDFERAQNKPDLEKQYDILAFLQAHRGSGSCLAPSVIYRSTGIDLDLNPTVAAMLQRNPKIRVEMIPDPENPALLVPTYAYQAKYSSIRDSSSLLAQINRMSYGVPVRDLIDSYPGVENDIQELITAGEVIAVANTEDKDRVLFPRGEDFLVELDGIVSLPSQPIALVPSPSLEPNDGSSSSSSSPPKTSAAAAETTASKQEAPPVYFVETDVDPTSQIRRGEAVQVGGQWFRVSSAVREGVSLTEQPARAQAPLSVVSLADLSKRNEVDGYIRPFHSKVLPLDRHLSSAAQGNIRKAKRARELLSRAVHGTGLSAGGGTLSSTTAGGAAASSAGGGSHRLLSSGLAQQLLGSLAHASNPTALLAAASQSSMGSSRNKRKAPSFTSSSSSSAAAAMSAATSSSTAASKLLAEATSDPALYLYRHARRHGTTKDVRQMYLETRDLVPDADADLHALLLEHRLIEPGEHLRRPRLSKNAGGGIGGGFGGAAGGTDNDGKPKKRRYYERKNQRMTNTHLEGTEIGALLALATEKQKQGETVGDGGM